MNTDTLSTLLADPARAASIPREEIPEALGQVERLRAVLWAKLTHPESVNGSPRVSDIERASKDRLLTVKEAAPQLGLSRKALYRRAARLPFTRRLGPRTLRFSQNGLTRWLARQ